ncbi:MAG: hypothetical protein ACRDQB_09885 [Thermocrispum sp.]
MLAVLLDNRLKEIEAAVRAVEHPEIDRLEEIDPAYMPGHKKGVAASFEVPMGDTSAGPAGRVTSRLDGAKDGRS